MNKYSLIFYLYHQMLKNTIYHDRGRKRFFNTIGFYFWVIICFITHKSHDFQIGKYSFGGETKIFLASTS